MTEKSVAASVGVAVICPLPSKSSDRTKVLEAVLNRAVDEGMSPEDIEAVQTAMKEVRRE